MGASPIGIVVVNRYTASTTDAQFAEVMEGVVIACAKFNLPLLGGDSGSYECPVLSAAALGLCPRGKALLRSAGVAGDRLFLTGSVGVAGAAFRLLGAPPASYVRDSVAPELVEELLRPWRRVEPALAQGQALARTGLSRCAIDTSDGLKTAARHLARSCRLDVVLDANAIPVTPALQAAARLLGVDVIALALSDSVDFRLLFTASMTAVSQVESLFRANDWPLFQIGELTAARAEAAAYLRSGSSFGALPGIEKAQ